MAVQVNTFSDESKRSHWQPWFVWLEGLFYFFQGFYLTGMQTFLGVSMANFGLALDQQANVSAMLGIPSYTKMFIGLLSDRLPFVRFGRRKPYIALGALLYVPAFALLLSMKQYGFWWIAAALAAQLAWVMVDTTLDALTVDVTPQEYAGKMQGAAQGSRMAGMGLGILLVPMIGPAIGWPATVTIIALCALLQSGAALAFREQPVDRNDLKGQLSLGVVLKQVVTRKLAWLGVVYSIFFMGSIGINSIISAYMLTELGWSQSPSLMAIYGTANLVHYGAAALGSLLIGRFMAKYKNNQNFYAFIAILFWLSILPWFLVGNDAANTLWVYVAQFTYGMGRGMMTVLVYSIVMRICPKSIEGFMFATLTSAMNIGLYTITPKTMAYFTPKLGLAPSMFSVVPYTIIGLIALSMILTELNKKGQETVLPETAESA